METPHELTEQSGQNEMDQLMKSLATMAPVKQGTIIKGRIVQVLPDGVLVDIGGKAEGLVPAVEWGGNHLEEAQPGAEVEVFVLRRESREEETEGMVLLSKRRADYERAWQRILDAHEKGDILTVLVKDRVKGGLVVDLGLEGFVPASQVLIPKGKRLEHLVGRTIKVKILEIERDRRRVLCSNKMALEEDRASRRQQVLETLKEGMTLEGVVRRITDFGAFVDLGGVDGLLHISEMSWGRLNHPSEALRVGQKIQVAVIGYDPSGPRISLSLKPLLPDPWRTAEKDYPINSRVTGVVSRIVPFGAFVRLPTGIEGVIPSNELSEKRGVKAEDILKVGQEVEAKVLQVSPQQRRILLSLRQVAQEQERLELREYLHQQPTPKVTIGDYFPDPKDKRRKESEESAEEEEE
ncbi:MAG: S1 RNA-binding domain-containing protein [Armatimonadetes bacterium]|nr:S1 RNA-binding domain-containing protein [Armatimonadota bacterium]MDW8121520.1 S1 RNA-binding domain-containing protein [Armatimonadota bacterium]